MNPQTLQQPRTVTSDEAVVRALYQRFIDGWNDGNAVAFAPPLPRMETSSHSTVLTSKGAAKSYHFTKGFFGPI